MKMDALNHPNVTSEHISKALNDDTSDMRQAEKAKVQLRNI